MSRGENGGNRPAHEIRLGRVKATLWANRNNDGALWYSVRISRLYKDGEGNWQEADSFSRDDLPVVAKVADLAHTWVFQEGRAAQD